MKIKTLMLERAGAGFDPTVFEAVFRRRNPNIPLRMGQAGDGYVSGWTRVTNKDVLRSEHGSR